MKKLTAHLMILTAFVALPFAPAAFADTISGTGGDGFQTWAQSDLATSGAPYWNHVSSDQCSGNCTTTTNRDNIGYILTDSGDAVGTLSSPPGAIKFWGQSFTSGSGVGGGADPSFHFVNNSTGGGAVLEAKVTARTANNAFGWFDIGTPTVLNQIFAGGTSTLVGTTATFTPSSNYGFYFTTCEAGSPTCTNLVVWETVASNNTVDAGDQHFTAFQKTATPGSEVYWLGMEDLRFFQSDKDYQDMIVKITYQGGIIPPTSVVPEPSSMMLLGSGLLAVSIGIALRRRVFTR